MFNNEVMSLTDDVLASLGRGHYVFVLEGSRLTQQFRVGQHVQVQVQEKIEDA